MNVQSFRILLVILFVLVSLSFARQRPREDNLGYNLILAEELRDKIARKEMFILVDCRPEEEYQAGHIPGAVNVSMDSYTFAGETMVKSEMEKIKESVGREIHFVLIDSKTGEEYMPKTKILELMRYLPQDRDGEVIFYCRRLSCTRSPMAARWAVALGYKNVWRYEGGWEEWSEKKYPVEK
jgi:thiosulfate/3-mercaptopyruvate sulfurtransferase